MFVTTDDDCRRYVPGIYKSIASRMRTKHCPVVFCENPFYQEWLRSMRSKREFDKYYYADWIE